MRTVRQIALGVLLVALLSGMAWAGTQEPKAFMQDTLTTFINILKDPKYANGKNRAQQDERVWNLMHKAFDFIAVSQRALGRNWRSFSPDQRKKFSGVFSELLGVTYLNKIREGYTNQEFKITEQEMLRKDTRALVKSLIKREKGDTSVDYMLYLSKTGWRIYDVNIEGVSLVKNYRAQFSKILLKDPPEVLIERVKEKVAKLKADIQAKQG